MSLLFPDNTVLCNFASVHSLDVLRDVLDGRGRWCEAVRREARDSAHYLPDLASVESDGWLGPAIEIDDPDEAHRIDVIRRTMLGGSSRQATQHLGEAQTCFVIAERDEFAGSVWVSDDRDALEHATFRRIPTLQTMNLVSEAVDSSLLTRSAGFALLEQMVTVGRSISMPDSAADL